MKKIIIIVSVVLLIAVGLTTFYIVVQSGAKEEADLLKADIEELNKELEELLLDFEEMTQENIDLIKDEKSAFEENSLLTESVTALKGETDDLNKKTPKKDLGISPESILMQMGILLKENEDESGYAALSGAPVKSEAENGNNLATIFIEGDENSEKYLMISFEIDQYNDNTANICVLHKNMPELYDEYKELVAQGYIMVYESPYIYNEEIIGAADKAIKDGVYETSGAQFKEETDEGGASFTIAPKE